MRLYDTTYFKCKWKKLQGNLQLHKKGTPQYLLAHACHNFSKIIPIPLALLIPLYINISSRSEHTSLKNALS